MKREKVKKSNKKKILIISTIVIAIIVAVILFLIIRQNNNSITSQLDKILSSNNTEVIFFERQGQFESDEFKELLDTDLKEQGITYTTIDLTNATYEELEYITLKLNAPNEDFNYYIVAINGSENLFYLDYSSFDKTMFTFANNGLLNDNQGILNEYYYKLGKEALEEGLLYTAKKNLEKIDYKDSKELLKDKRFLLMHEWKYNYSDKYHINSITAQYNDYNDSFSIYKTECNIFEDVKYCSEHNTYDAKVVDDKIFIRPFLSDGEYENYYTIKKLNDSEFQLEGWNFVMKR